LVFTFSKGGKTVERPAFPIVYVVLSTSMVHQYPDVLGMLPDDVKAALAAQGIHPDNISSIPRDDARLVEALFNHSATAHPTKIDLVVVPVPAEWERHVIQHPTTRLEAVIDLRQIRTVEDAVPDQEDGVLWQTPPDVDLSRSGEALAAGALAKLQEGLDQEI
jgi:hypothetical protein